MKTDLFALAEEIARHESEIGDIRPGAEKHLVLNGGGERTQFSFVYVHGFTASRRETAPLADRVAARFGGNLFYTRLRGHGRRPESMAEVTLDDWYQDVEDAVSVGAEAGKSVVLIGCSTGAALSLWYASQSRNPRICALVLLSPNYSTRNLIARYLDTPLGYLLTRIFPVHRPGRDLQSPLVRRFWYRSYPTRALIPMIQLLKRVRLIRKKSVGIPALTVYSEHDRVVSPKAVRKMKNRFAGPSETVVFNRTGSGNCHILAGDILSPQTTGEVARLICAFLQNYLR